MQVRNATVSVGGGTAILTLPGVSFMSQSNAARTVATGRFDESDDFGDEIGWNINGSVEIPLADAKMLSLSGFWANIDDDSSATCRAIPGVQDCYVANPIDGPGQTSVIHGGPGLLVTLADRDVDHWGASLEVKKIITPDIMGVTKAPQRRYLALGTDIRGIDQDLELDTFAQGFPTHILYSENLETRYYGAYAAWGGGLPPPPPRRPVGAVGPALYLPTARWRLLRRYRLFRDHGRPPPGLAPLNSTLSLSNDEVAFIGGLSFETRKRIGQRATISLKSDYEYYSYVPEILYNNNDAGFRVGTQVGTVINDDDALSMRSSLRLTIGLGPRTLYQEPMK